MLAAQLGAAPGPVLVARVEEWNGWLIELERGFIVPDDWSEQAAERRRDGRLPS